MMRHIDNLRLKPREPFGKSTLLFIALAIPSGRPNVEIDGFHLVESQDDKRLVEIRADTASVFKVESLTSLKNIVANLYSDDDLGRINPRPYRVEGQIGVLNSNTQDFTVYNSAKVVSPENYEFLARSVDYSASQKVLTSQELVNCIPPSKEASGGMNISGIGLKIVLKQSTYDLLKNVRAEQKLANGGDLLITSHSSRISPKEQNAAFTKNVLVKTNDIEMRGEKLVINFEKSTGESNPKVNKMALTGDKSKRITAKLPDLKIESQGLNVLFSPNGDLAESQAIGAAEGLTKDGIKLRSEELTSTKRDGQNVVLLKRKVEILTSNRTAHCEDAEFYPETGEVKLRRIASVRSGDQLIEGDVIRFNTKGSEIVVEKARGSMSRDDLSKKPQSP
jgi:LPS export ABC transporter protein LptC